MERTAKNRTGAIVTAALLAVIALLGGLAFLPSIRGGSTPATYAMQTDEEAIRALGCCRASIYSREFIGQLSGSVKAKVFGLPITLRLTGSRSVSGEDYTEVVEGRSRLVKAAIKREGSGDGIAVSRGTYENKRFVYGQPKHYSREQYIETFGKPNTDIVRYELDGAIVCAETVGDNTYRFVLDPARATAFCRNEIKYVLGGKSVEYDSVEFTLVTDGEAPTSVTVKEVFKVDKFGGTTCRAEYTEVFSFK